MECMRQIDVSKRVLNELTRVIFWLKFFQRSQSNVGSSDPSYLTYRSYLSYDEK